jgi:REP element-mobilizing transposase RayT
MGRPKRAADGGLIYHGLNRANARMPIFEKDGDYEAFEVVLQEAVERTETRLLAYCLLPNHWHLIVWPREDGELSTFTGWLTLTHTQRWHADRRTTGSGRPYQGRFKSSSRTRGVAFRRRDRLQYSVASPANKAHSRFRLGGSDRLDSLSCCRRTVLTP